jgi:hypothetical protein
VQCFLDFANFYRIFINNYLKIAAPLTHLIGKDKFVWDEQAKKAFEALKKAFTSTPILVHANSSKPFFLEADVSDFAFGSVLSQYGEYGRLHPIAYHSRKFSAAEINYEIHDKEFFAIIDAFEEWCHLLERAQHTTTVYTDYKNLEYFMSVQVLNQRQARWNVSLSCFDFVITYRPGNLQRKHDALLRQSYLAPKEVDPILDQQNSIILKPTNFQLKALAMSFGEDASYIKEVQEALQDDLFIENIKNRLRANEVNDEFEFKDGLLYFNGLLYIPPGPTRLKMIQMRHNLPVARHFGFNKTMKLISRDFWWPQMWKLVMEFI